jgi:hypothetical protein
MAEDSKQTLKELERSISGIQQASEELVLQFGEGLVNSLQKSIDKTVDLKNQIKAGKDISKELSGSFNIVRRTQIDLINKQRSLESQLSKARSQSKQNEISEQLRFNSIQQKLNEDILVELDGLRQVNKELQKSNQLNKILETTSKKILNNQASTVMEMFTLTGLFAFIIKGAIQFQKYSVEAGKALGYGASESNRVQSNFNSIARSTFDVNVNSKSLNEAFSQLVQSTGYISEFSEDTLKTQIMLTRQFGLTGEEASKIYELSVLTGKSSSQVNDEMVGAFVATRNQLKVGVPFRAAMAAAAKISGQLAANLQNNPALITKAVVQAAALGTTLEQTSSQAEKLLDFSSSIESELKAELLTGKQLNLERARAAALAGDQVTLAQELASNLGSIEEFQRMNVLQQKSLAEAVGLTSDQLADQLRKQKIAEETGKSLAQITKEEALEAQKRQDIQSKFNAGIEKLQSLIGGLLAGPLGEFLDILTKSLDYVTSIGLGLATWYITSKSILGIQKAISFFSLVSRTAKMQEVGFGTALIAQLGRALGLSTAKATADTISATALSFGTLLPIILGAGAAIYGMLSTMDDGIIGPGGETVVSGPKGSIKLNKDDSIVAGTNLFDKGNNQAISPSINLTPMISAINEVRDAVNKLYSKDTSINMDGKKVGTTLTQGSYKVA